MQLPEMEQVIALGERLFGRRGAPLFGRALARFDRRRCLLFGVVEESVHDTASTVVEVSVSRSMRSTVCAPYTPINTASLLLWSLRRAKKRCSRGNIRIVSWRAPSLSAPCKWKCRFHRDGSTTTKGTA